MALKNPELVHLGKYFSSMFMSVCELLLRSTVKNYNTVLYVKHFSCWCSWNSSIFIFTSHRQVGQAAGIVKLDPDSGTNRAPSSVFSKITVSTQFTMFLTFADKAVVNWEIVLIAILVSNIVTAWCTDRMSAVTINH